MAIIVYWTLFEEEWIRAEEPESVYKKLISTKRPSENSPLAEISKCPSIYHELKNTFGLKSVYEYEFSLTQEGLYSKNGNKFFEDHLMVRDFNNKFFSLLQRYLFFTEEKSLGMTAYLSPFLENNPVSQNTYSIPGNFDIGKWFRNIEMNFFMKDGVTDFKISEGDIYTYIKFDTDEKIIFKKFVPNDNLKFYIKGVWSSTDNGSTGKSLGDFYKMLNFKKQVIKEIKKCLVD
jgi:hypothetical protein